MMARNSHGPKGMIWTGRVLSGLIFAATIGGAIYGLIHPETVKREMVGHHGYPANSIPWILIAEIVSAVLYVIPRTAVLGAILLTGYFGGATATHVRLGEPAFVIPVVVGVIVWLGLVLRDSRLRALLPFRSI